MSAKGLDAIVARVEAWKASRAALRDGEEVHATPCTQAHRDLIELLNEIRWRDHVMKERVLKAEDACTGFAAVWCPRCGDCTGCDRELDVFKDDCPLHGTASKHEDLSAVRPSSDVFDVQDEPAALSLTWAVHINSAEEFVHVGSTLAGRRVAFVYPDEAGRYWWRTLLKGGVEEGCAESLEAAQMESTRALMAIAEEPPL